MCSFFQSLFSCDNLEYLTVSDNDLSSLPPTLAGLSNLKYLDISKNGKCVSVVARFLLFVVWVSSRSGCRHSGWWFLLPIPLDDIPSPTIPSYPVLVGYWSSLLSDWRFGWAKLPKNKLHNSPKVDLKLRFRVVLQDPPPREIALTADQNSIKAYSLVTHLHFTVFHFPHTTKTGLSLSLILEYGSKRLQTVADWRYAFQNSICTISVNHIAWVELRQNKICTIPSCSVINILHADAFDSYKIYL